MWRIRKNREQRKVYFLFGDRISSPYKIRNKLLCSAIFDKVDAFGKNQVNQRRKFESKLAADLPKDRFYSIQTQTGSRQTPM